MGTAFLFLPNFHYFGLIKSDTPHTQNNNDFFPPRQNNNIPVFRGEFCFFILISYEMLISFS